MRLRNTPTRYGAITIALHWLGAAMVVAMLGTALMMAIAPGREAYLPWVKLHGSLGAVFWIVLAARVAWHFIDRPPRKLSDSRALRAAAAGVHIALLVLIAMQLVTGPLDIWSGGFPFGVFDAFVVPNPVGKTFDAWHDALGEFHGYTGLAIALLVVLHLMGVAKHVLLDRDETLGRMLGRNPRAVVD